MDFSNEVANEIKAAIEKKVPQGQFCPVCGRNSWQVASGLVSLVLQQNLHSLQLAGPSLPCAVLVCSICGYTELINLIVLGLTDLVTRLNAEERKTEEATRATVQKPVKK